MLSETWIWMQGWNFHSLRLKSTPSLGMGTDNQPEKIKGKITWVLRLPTELIQLCQAGAGLLFRYKILMFYDLCI